MDKFPLLWEGHPWGELAVERGPLYTVFDVRCPLPGQGLWCAWAVGEDGELRLGVLEEAQGPSALRRRFSQQMTRPIGPLLRGEVRPSLRSASAWEPSPQPGALFHAPWLRQRLQNARGALTRCQGGRRLLALPYRREDPFPLTTLFCFAHIRSIEGRTYAVFAFDGADRPVFP